MALDKLMCLNLFHSTGAIWAKGNARIKTSLRNVFDIHPVSDSEWFSRTQTALWALHCKLHFHSHLYVRISLPFPIHTGNFIVHLIIICIKLFVKIKFVFSPIFQVYSLNSKSESCTNVLPTRFPAKSAVILYRLTCQYCLSWHFHFPSPLLRNELCVNWHTHASVSINTGGII